MSKVDQRHLRVRADELPIEGSASNVDDLHAVANAEFLKKPLHAATSKVRVILGVDRVDPRTFHDRDASMGSVLDVSSADEL